MEVEESSANEIIALNDNYMVICANRYDERDALDDVSENNGREKKADEEEEEEDDEEREIRALISNSQLRFNGRHSRSAHANLVHMTNDSSCRSPSQKPKKHANSNNQTNRNDDQEQQQKYNDNNHYGSVSAEEERLEYSSSDEEFYEHHVLAPLRKSRSVVAGMLTVTTNNNKNANKNNKTTAKNLAELRELLNPPLKESIIPTTPAASFVASYNEHEDETDALRKVKSIAGSNVAQTATLSGAEFQNLRRYSPLLLIQAENALEKKVDGDDVRLARLLRDDDLPNEELERRRIGGDDSERGDSSDSDNVIDNDANELGSQDENDEEAEDSDASFSFYGGSNRALSSCVRREEDDVSPAQCWSAPAVCLEDEDDYDEEEQYSEDEAAPFAANEFENLNAANLNEKYEDSYDEEEDDRLALLRIVGKKSPIKREISDAEIARLFNQLSSSAATNRCINWSAPANLDQIAAHDAENATPKMRWKKGKCSRGKRDDEAIDDADDGGFIGKSKTFTENLSERIMAVDEVKFLPIVRLNDDDSDDEKARCSDEEESDDYSMPLNTTFTTTYRNKNDSANSSKVVVDSNRQKIESNPRAKPTATTANDRVGHAPDEKMRARQRGEKFVLDATTAEQHDDNDAHSLNWHMKRSCFSLNDAALLDFPMADEGAPSLTASALFSHKSLDALHNIANFADIEVGKRLAGSERSPPFASADALSESELSELEVRVARGDFAVTPRDFAAPIRINGEKEEETLKKSTSEADVAAEHDMVDANNDADVRHIFTRDASIIVANDVLASVVNDLFNDAEDDVKNESEHLDFMEENAQEGACLQNQLSFDIEERQSLRFQEHTQPTTFEHKNMLASGESQIQAQQSAQTNAANSSVTADALKSREIPSTFRDELLWLANEQMCKCASMPCLKYVEPNALLFAALRRPVTCGNERERVDWPFSANRCEIDATLKAGDNKGGGASDDSAKSGNDLAHDSNLRAEHLAHVMTRSFTTGATNYFGYENSADAANSTQQPIAAQNKQRRILPLRPDERRHAHRQDAYLRQPYQQRIHSPLSQQPANFGLPPVSEFDALLLSSRHDEKQQQQTLDEQTILEQQQQSQQKNNFHALPPSQPPHKRRLPQLPEAVADAFDVLPPLSLRTNSSSSGGNGSGKSPAQTAAHVVVGGAASASDYRQIENAAIEEEIVANTVDDEVELIEPQRLLSILAAESGMLPSTSDAKAAASTHSETDSAYPQHYLHFEQPTTSAVGFTQRHQHYSNFVRHPHHQSYQQQQQKQQQYRRSGGEYQLSYGMDASLLRSSTMTAAEEVDVDDDEFYHGRRAQATKPKRNYGIMDDSYYEDDNLIIIDNGGGANRAPNDAHNSLKFYADNENIPTKSSPFSNSAYNLADGDNSSGISSCCTSSSTAAGAHYGSDTTKTTRKKRKSGNNNSNKNTVDNEDDVDDEDDRKPTHRAQFAFVPRHSDEIRLEIGDAIHVDRTSDDHWCYGTNLKTGSSGIFPAAHICEIDLVEEICQGALTSAANFAVSHKQERDTFYLTMLASVEVAHHKGNDVLVQAINKVCSMYQQKDEVLVPQTVLVEISFRGIHVIDKRKKDFFRCPTFDFFYSLQNISFCGAHPKQLRYFGFITKHPLLPRFACHVFLSRESTQPIVESIGRAFKRSYDEYMAFAHPTEDIFIE